MFNQEVNFLGATPFEDTAFQLAKTLVLKPISIAQGLTLHRVKRTPDYEEYNFENLGINVKLQHLNTNTNTGHIADITVNDLAKLHLPCIYGKVLKLNVEFNQTESQLNASVNYHFLGRNNFSGTLKLEQSKLENKLQTKLKYLNIPWEVDIQSADTIHQAIITSEHNKYIIKANIDPGVIFSLTVEDQAGNNLVDFLINFQSWETKFRVDDSVYQFSELKIEDHADYIEISFFSGNLKCNLEFSKQTKSIKIYAYYNSRVLLDLRFEQTNDKKNVYNHEYEMSYQLGNHLFNYKTHGKIRFQENYESRRENNNYDVYINQRMMNITWLPIYPYQPELNLEMYLDEKSTSYGYYKYKTYKSIKIKGSEQGSQMLAVQTNITYTNKDSWTGSMNAEVLFNSSFAQGLRYYNKYIDFSQVSLTAEAESNSASVYISKNRSPLFKIDIMMEAYQYYIKMSAFKISKSNPLFPYSIQKLFGRQESFDIHEFYIEVNNNMLHIGFSGVLSTSQTISKLDFKMEKNLKSGKFILTVNDHVLLYAELKEDGNLTNQLEVQTLNLLKLLDIFKCNYKIIANGNSPVSLLTFVQKLFRNEKNLFEIEFTQNWISDDYESLNSNKVQIKTGEYFELNLNSSTSTNITNYIYDYDYHNHNGKEVQKINIYGNGKFYLDPSFTPFRILANYELKEYDEQKKMLNLDFGITTANLFKLFIYNLVDLEAEIGGLNYISLNSTIENVKNLTVTNAGESAFINLNGINLFSFEVASNTENFEIKINIPISLITDPTFWYFPIDIDKQDVFTVVVYSNTTTMMGIYIKGTDNCINDYRTPTLELSKYHKVGFNSESMMLGSWRGVTNLYRCMGNEFVWTLIRMGADITEDQDPIEEKNMNYDGLSYYDMILLSKKKYDYNPW